MSHKLFCDHCGVTNATVGRFTLNPAVSTPHGTTTLPKFDGELCKGCLESLCEAFNAMLRFKSHPQ